MRNTLMAAALAACAVIAVAASQPVTLVLKSGERISGQMTSPISTSIALEVNGQRRDIPLDQIAIVAFKSGDPAASELNQLPQTGSAMVAMADGTIVHAKWDRFSVDGGTVTVDNDNGSRRDIAANQVARVYLDAASARQVYSSVLNASTAAPANGRNGAANPGGSNAGNPGGSNAGNPGGRNGAGNSNGRNGAGDSGARNGAGDFGGRNRGANDGTITVTGNQPWTETGIAVNAGDRITFNASGSVRTSRDNASPDGTANSTGSRRNSNRRYPLPSGQAGALIGRVGPNGPVFAIGSNTRPITMPASGLLYLGINDDEFDGRSGGFTVTIGR